MKLSEIQISYNYSNSNIKLTNSRSVFNLLLDNWNKETIQLLEEFKVLLLNRNNIVLGIYQVSKGGIAGTVVDPKLIFGVALKSVASSIILAHNHPSGNLKPSPEDLRITKKLVEAGKVLEIQVLDHLIITDIGYYSFADEGLLQ